MLWNAQEKLPTLSFWSRTGTLASSTAPLSVTGLTVAYHGAPVLWNINYESPEQGLVAIVGPNGAGKSTFLKAVLGLTRKLTGKVCFWGQRLPQVRRRVAYVPQRSDIDTDFPVSVLDVVCMGLYGRMGWIKPVGADERATAMAALERVQMTDYADRQIGQLSGGQQQRVFLARALVQDADLYCLDEPFSGIDETSEHLIFQVLQELAGVGKTVFVVHHDLQTVRDRFEHVILLNREIIADGPVADVLTDDAISMTYSTPKGLDFLNV